MGNEQSVQRKQPNKLSKPKTNNNSVPNLLTVKSAPPTRRNSVSTNNDSSIISRDSRPLGESVGTGRGREEPTKKKRLSLFRSRSAKPKRTIVDLDIGIERTFLDPTPVELPSQRWSTQPAGRGRGNSFMTDVSVDESYYDPNLDAYVQHSS
jgi:hypothetical protein